MQLLDRLKRFDAYPKTLEEVQVRTTSGATISIVSMVIIFVLVVSEFSAYISTGTHHELYVDTTVGEQLQINFDVTFPRLACAYVSVDLMDVSGNHELDVDHNIFKKRLSSDGIPVGEDVLARVLGDPLIEIPEKRPGCGTCYSAERSDAQCCNTCTEVMDAYRSRGWAVSQPETIAQCQREGYNQLLKEQKDEGCQLYGTLQVSKVRLFFFFFFFLLFSFAIGSTAVSDDDQFRIPTESTALMLNFQSLLLMILLFQLWLSLSLPFPSLSNTHFFFL